MNYSVYMITEKVKTFTMLIKEFMEDIRIENIENLNKKDNFCDLDISIITLKEQIRPLEKCLKEIKDYIQRYEVK